MHPRPSKPPQRHERRDGQMVDESEFDDTADAEDLSVDETYYDEFSGELAYRWRDPLRPTGIGDSEDTWY